jgi:hypothetical protein
MNSLYLFSHMNSGEGDLCKERKANVFGDRPIPTLMETNART